MAQAQHLKALHKRHEALEEKIHLELQHPSSDDQAIRRLKEEKLFLKEEISKLESGRA